MYNMYNTYANQVLASNGNFGQCGIFVCVSALAFFQRLL